MEMVCPTNLEGASDTSREPLPRPLMAEVFPSTLNSYDLKKFRRVYDIPGDIILCAPKEFKQACDIKHEEVCLYEQALATGY